MIRSKSAAVIREIQQAPFAKIAHRLFVSDYVARSDAENFSEDRFFTLVVDKKHIVYEDLAVLDIRAGVPDLSVRYLYDRWKESGDRTSEDSGND